MKCGKLTCTVHEDGHGDAGCPGAARAVRVDGLGQRAGLGGRLDVACVPWAHRWGSLFAVPAGLRQ